MRREIWFIAFVLMVLPSCGGDANQVSRAASALTTETMEVTSYGYPDNSPAGTQISFPKSSGYPTIHDHAGGTGTYADPLTMASDESWLPIGTILYVPMLKKYVVMEDHCDACTTDWNNSSLKHIDVWMNSDARTLSDPALTDLKNCQGNWTRCLNGVQCAGGSGTSVMSGVDSACIVDTTPTFNLSTNACWSGSGTGSCDTSGGGGGGGGGGGTEYYGCYASGSINGYSCLSPFLQGDTACVENTHYVVSAFDTGSSPYSVIAPHGGLDVTGQPIEAYTSTIAVALANRWGWNYYYLKQIASCAHNLHITSTHFNDSRAVNVLQARAGITGIGIHGCASCVDNATPTPNPVICVGGLSSTMRTNWIYWYNTYVKPAYASAGYGTAPAAYDTTVSPGSSYCSALTGIAANNISNRGTSGNGLHLEMPVGFRNAVYSNATVASNFYDAVYYAMTGSAPGSGGPPPPPAGGGGVLTTSTSASGSPATPTFPYSGYYADIYIKNTGTSSVSSFYYTATVPAGTVCQNVADSTTCNGASKPADGGGTVSCTQSGLQCTYTFSYSLAAGAVYDAGWTGDSASGTLTGVSAGAGGSCTPTTCAALGANCGTPSDGCGGTLSSCGTCTAPQSCGGGGTPNVCGGGATLTTSASPTGSPATGTISFSGYYADVYIKNTGTSSVSTFHYAAVVPPGTNCQNVADSTGCNGTSRPAAGGGTVSCTQNGNWCTYTFAFTLAAGAVYDAGWTGDVASGQLGNVSAASP